MARLKELALRYQQALDSLADSTTAGNALSSAANSPGDGFQTLEPIILQTTLATSITVYLERISTPAVLLGLEGASVDEATIAGEVLGMLVQCAIRSHAASDARSPVAALLLRQVNFPHS